MLAKMQYIQAHSGARFAQSLLDANLFPQFSQLLIKKLAYLNESQAMEKHWHTTYNPPFDES